MTDRPNLTTPPSDEASSRSAEIYLEAARRFLDLQVGTDEILDTRNITIFSIGSTILPVTFGLLNLAETAIPHRAQVALIIALAAYVFLLAFSWRASSIRGLEYRRSLPVLEGLLEEYEDDFLCRWVGKEYADSAAVNRDVMNRKSRWIGAANVCLYIEAFLVSLAALWTLLRANVFRWWERTGGADDDVGRSWRGKLTPFGAGRRLIVGCHAMFSAQRPTRISLSP